MDLGPFGCSGKAAGLRLSPLFPSFGCWRSGPEQKDNNKECSKEIHGTHWERTQSGKLHQIARYFGWINAARDTFLGLWGQWGKFFKRHARGYSGHGKSPVVARFTNYTLLVVWGNFLLVSLRLTREFRMKFKDSPLPHVLCLMTKWYQMTVKWLSNDYEWLRNSSPNVSETDLHWSSWTFPRADRAPTAELPTLQWSPGDLPRRTTCRSATADLAAFWMCLGFLGNSHPTEKSLENLGL